MANFLKNRLVQIILLGAFLRLLFLGSTPLSLNWDEVSQGYTAYSVAQTGADEWGEKFPLVFRSYGEWKSPVYIYLLVPFIKAFGLNAWSIRLPSALAGIISLYLLYLLGKKLYSEKVGLWAAFLMAVTPWSFMLSRPAFEANVALMLILLGTYSFLNQKLLISALAFGLAPHTYNSAKIVVPLLVMYLVWSTQLYKQWKSMILYGLVLAFFAFPILTGLISGQSQARYTQVGITTDQAALTSFYKLRQSLPLPSLAQKLLVNNGTFFIYHLTNNMLAYVSPGFLFWHGGDHTQQSMPYHGVLYLSQSVLVLAGLAYLLVGGDKKRSATALGLPLIFIVLGIIPAAMTRDPEHVLRSLLAIPGFILISALGFEHLASLKNSRIRAVVTALLALEIVLFMTIYFTWYPRAYARDWQYGYPQVAEYLKNHEGEYDTVVMTKWFGEPQLFLALYNSWDPAWYQKMNQVNLRYESEGRMWLDQLDSYSIDKYTFKYLNWPTESRSSKTLYIGKFDDFDVSTKIEKTITYPDGSVAFHIVKGDK